jgi:glyoxylase-like metal-dependent hydrolase (beta-lactamase superfamily II)
MCPYSAYFINGINLKNFSNSPGNGNSKIPFLTLFGVSSYLTNDSIFFSPGRMVCHCLLIETNEGLILVDTGIGLQDIANPKIRLGKLFTSVARPVLDPTEAAVNQIIKLGFKPEDVRHIVLTHLDLDHAGGLPDFPKAKIHVFEPEYKAATNPLTFQEKMRYRSTQWQHNPSWEIHSLKNGESWFGFDKVQAIVGNETEVLLIPVIGHSWGHCAVAVKTSQGWLVHCGDAYFFHGEMDPEVYRCTLGLRLFQHIVQVDGQARINNQDRLRKLVKNHSNEVKVFCAHDPEELSLFQTQ